jgi:hypothetical protein
MIGYLTIGLSSLIFSYEKFIFQCFFFLIIIFSSGISFAFDCGKNISNLSAQFEKLNQKDFQNNHGIIKQEFEDKSRELKKGFFFVLPGFFFSTENGSGSPLFIRKTTSGSQQTVSGRFSRSPPFSVFSYV